MDIKITPFTITAVATKLSVTITGVSLDGESAFIYYRLLKEDGTVAEQGNKTIPVEALGLIAMKNPPIEMLNQMLAGWGLNAEEVVPPVIMPPAGPMPMPIEPVEPEQTETEQTEETED